MSDRARPAPAEARAPRGARRERWVLAIVAAGVFVAADDQTSIVAVLPAIIDDVGIAVDEFYRISWIVNGYLLGYLAALPLLGRIADVHGRACIFAGTLAIFLVGSVLVAFAPSYAWIVAARALQAIGGGGVVPVAMAIVVDELPPAKRALGLGAIAAASEAGALLGPLWGGAITDWLGWRWVFWINVPMTLPVLAAGWWALANRPAGGRIDWLGGALLAAALAVLTVALVDDPLDPRPWPATAVLLATSALLAATFAWQERRARASLVRLAMFAPRPVWAAHAAHVLLGGGLIAALIAVPLFVNLVLGERPLAGGLTLMRLTVAVPLGALAGGWLAGAWGLRPTAVTGMWVAAAGLAGLAAWDQALAEPLRSAPLLVAGLGFGLVVAPLGTAVLQHVAEAERATAAAWLTLARIAGMLAGAGLLTSHGLGRFYARAGSATFGSPEFAALVATAQVDTFREVFLAAAVAMFIAGLVALLIGCGRAPAGERWWTLS
ncbi:MAG: MFS transporter [Chloroflexi bacterium]|nr:MFS transporter [Chloroflexota bacterium]